MAAVDRLMGVGETAEIAKRTGFFINPALTDGVGKTFQGPGNQVIVVSAASSSVILGDQFDLGDEVYIIAHTGVSLYPAATHFIWPTSAGVVRAVTSGVNKHLIKTSQLVWELIATA